MSVSQRLSKLETEVLELKSMVNNLENKISYETTKKKQPDIRVIKILSSEQIVINVGTKTVPRVNIGTKLAILGDKEEIYDPDTGKFLGTYIDEKEHVMVEEVYEKMAVCCASLNYFKTLKIHIEDIHPRHHDKIIRLNDKLVLLPESEEVEKWQVDHSVTKDIG